MLKPGDVVTVLFAYSDLSGSKIRPALVVSGDAFNRETGDAVLMAVSARPVQGAFEAPVERWQEAGLRRPSKLRAGNLLTVRGDLTQRIGRLSQDDWAKAKELLARVLAEEAHENK